MTTEFTTAEITGQNVDLLPARRTLQAMPTAPDFGFDPWAFIPDPGADAPTTGNGDFSPLTPGTLTPGT